MGVARLFRPHSVLGLIIVGFTLALLPLAVALGVAATYVNKLARQSQVALVQAVEATQGARLLLSQITAMERSVRQYLVVQDAKLLEVYRENHADWLATLRRLEPLDLAVGQRAILDRLKAAERDLFHKFSQPPIDLEAGQTQAEEFTKARDLARVFLGHSMVWVDREAADLQALAGNATSMLTWVMATALPAVLVLAVAFAALINRPLRSMAKAIHRLGNEDFATPIVMHGPLDLEELGERLDWLRCRLAELEEQKSRFLRHMSHELKTPLTDLREGAELLTDEVVGPLTTEQREVVAILRENSLRLQQLIEGLLDFNQALMRNLTLHKAPVQLADLVNEVIEAQKLAWRARSLRVEARLEPLELTGDRDKLATVVDNLLSNAIKFSPPGRTVWIELKAVDGVAQLEVRDTGAGFHPDDQGRVFEAFYQGRTVADGHVKGSGLGLAIALEYARAHDGALRIGPGPGGRVRLQLPMQPRESL